MNGQSSDTGKIWHRHRMKKKSTKNTTQKIKEISKTDPSKKKR
jgi:hypothetical protein